MFPCVTQNGEMCTVGAPPRFIGKKLTQVLVQRQHVDESSDQLEGNVRAREEEKRTTLITSNGFSSLERNDVALSVFGW